MSSRNHSKPEGLSECEALKIAKVCKERAVHGRVEGAESWLLAAMTDVEPTSFAYVALRAAMDEVQAMPRDAV